jgi:sodium--glutamate symport carrier gltS
MRAWGSEPRPSPSSKAYLVVPLVGAFFIDLLNASRISSDELVCGGFLAHRNDLHTE